MIDSFEVVCDNGVYRIATKDDPEESVSDRVIKLRNPWGESDYKGDWYCVFKKEFWIRKVEPES